VVWCRHLIISFAKVAGIHYCWQGVERRMNESHNLKKSSFTLADQQLTGTDRGKKGRR
jgi:hypothetical protein